MSAMNELLELQVRVGSPGDDPEEVDVLTRELLTELRDQPVETADLVGGGTAPPGTKGLIGPEQMEIAIKVGAHAFMFVLAVIEKRLASRGGTIRFEGKLNGTAIKFEGAAREFARLVAGATAKPANRAR
jgi:hypothetical protein